MSSRDVPDYTLADVVVASSAEQLKALADPLRSTVLDLVLERAASVAELAEAVGRPKSSVAHHVGVLVDAGLLGVVRTRQVKAIEERFYGRTGRTIEISPAEHAGGVVSSNLLTDAAREAAPAAEADHLRSTLRHVRISSADARAFWERVLELADEFTRLPRNGDTVHAFVAGVFPTDQPILPEPIDEAGD